MKKSIELTKLLDELTRMEKEIKLNQEELVGEIKFLDEQLIYADKHHEILREELDSLSEDMVRLVQVPSKAQRLQPQSMYNMSLPKLSQH